MLDTSYLSEDRFPGLMDHDFQRNPLYTVLRSSTGRRSEGQREPADHLRNGGGGPAFADSARRGPVLHRGPGFDGADEPTEYARVTVRPERVQFSSSMS